MLRRREGKGKLDGHKVLQAWESAMKKSDMGSEDFDWQIRERILSAEAGGRDASGAISNCGTKEECQEGRYLSEWEEPANCFAHGPTLPGPLCKRPGGCSPC